MSKDRQSSDDFEGSKVLQMQLERFITGNLKF